MTEKFTLRPHNQRGYGVYTKTAWKKGDKIYSFGGNITPTYIASAKNSMTLNESFCFEWAEKGIQCYFNHSCNPNCYIDMDSGIPIVTAIRDISSDEELTYNYNTVELDLARDFLSFPCHCEQKNCIGWIKGFMYLFPKQEEEILSICSPFIKQKRKDYEKDRDPELF